MTAATLQANLQQLCEHIHDWRAADVEVDRSRRLVHNIALTGRDSKNGYRYSEQALRQAVPLYENKPVFLDHAANISRPHERSTRDLAGSIVNPRYEAGRIRSGIQLLDTEAGRTFLALAESRSPAVGMSHVVLAERSGDRSVVDVIHDVVSVDAVVFPATTSTFSEAAQGERPIPLAGSLEALLAEVDARLPEHARRLIDDPAATVQRSGLFADKLLFDVRRTEEESPRRSVIGFRIDDGRVLFGETIAPFEADQFVPRPWCAVIEQFQQRELGEPQIEQLQSQLRQAEEERNRLREELDRLQSEQAEAERRQEIERLLAESDLPETAQSELFREQLLSAPDAETRTMLIEERKGLLRRSSLRHPFSRTRDDGADSAPSDAAIIAAIRRQRPSVLLGAG